MTINAPAISKINWTNGMAFVVSLLAVLGIGIPEDWQNTILTFIATAVPVVTMIFRTWFTEKSEA